MNEKREIPQDDEGRKIKEKQNSSFDDVRV